MRRAPDLVRLRLVLAVLCLLALASGPAVARPLSEAERASLAVAVGRFNAAMTANDVAAIVDVVPPRFLAHLARQGGIDVSALRGAMIDQTRELMKTGILREFRMDLAGGREDSLRDGTPFVLLPTATTLRIESRDIVTSSETLGFRDGESWYLVDLADAGRVALFTQVYPEFADVKFGGKTIKAAP